MTSDHTRSSETDRLRAFWEDRYASFDLSASGWRGAGERFNQLAYRCKTAAVVRALRRIGVTEESTFAVLDAGCGQGFFADFFHTRYPKADYTGIDVSPRVIEHLRETRPWAQFVCGDLAAWTPDRSKRFDVVLSIEVLHLMTDDEHARRAVVHLASLLDPAGTFLVTAVLPPETVQPSDYLRFRSEAVHRNWWDAAGLREQFREAMYYWFPDGGPRWRATRALFFHLDPRIVYALDRVALRLRLPRVATGFDSNMQLLALRRATRS
jgi:SAM-dependent methyltransferase